MRISAMVRYFCAGMFLLNAVPHFLISLTGRRNLTPFGRDSSAAVNGVWAVLNAVVGTRLFVLADKKARTGLDETAWQLPFESGMLFFATFGFVYSLVTRLKSTQR